MDFAYQQGDPYLRQVPKSPRSHEPDDVGHEEVEHFPSYPPSFEPLPEIQVGGLADFSFDTLFRSLSEKHDIPIETEEAGFSVLTPTESNPVAPALMQTSALKNATEGECQPHFWDQDQQVDTLRRHQSPSSTDRVSSSTRSSKSITVASELPNTTNNRPLGLLRRFIGYRLGIPKVQQTGASFPSYDNQRNNQRADAEVSGNQSVWERRKAKRLRPEDDDYGSVGEAPERDGPNPCPRQLGKPKIACPFMKRCPAEFYAWRTCVGPGFDGMHRMKEHLKRKHFKEHTCHRCGYFYATNRLLQDHLRSPEPCRLQDVHADIGFMTQLQWDSINKKRQGVKTPILERWKEIYLILFPDTDDSCIPSPYFETAETTDGPMTAFDPEEYEACLRKQLPSKIITKLAKEFQIMSDEAKQRLAYIVQEESLEVLRTYVQRKGTASSNDVSNVCLPAFDTTSFDDSIFEDINMYGSGDELDYSHPFLGGDEWESSKGKEPQASDSGYGSLL